LGNLKKEPMIDSLPAPAVIIFPAKIADLICLAQMAVLGGGNLKWNGWKAKECGLHPVIYFSPKRSYYLMREASPLRLGRGMTGHGVLVTGRKRGCRVVREVLFHHLFFLNDSHPEHQEIER
jgi:hypothetical protein